MVNTFVGQTQNMMWQPIKKEAPKSFAQSHATSIINSSRNSANGTEMRAEGSKDQRSNNGIPSRRFYGTQANSLSRGGSENGNKLMKPSSMDRHNEKKDF